MSKQEKLAVPRKWKRCSVEECHCHFEESDMEHVETDAGTWYGPKSEANLVAGLPDLYRLLESLGNEMQAALSIGGRDGNYASKRWMERRIKRIQKLLDRVRKRG